MIKSFKDKDTQACYERQFVKRFSGIERQALRRLQILSDALSLRTLAGLPSNHLEPLQGDREGQYSIRVNEQWRLCFIWDAGAWEVELIDYH